MKTNQILLGAAVIIVGIAALVFMQSQGSKSPNPTPTAVASPSPQAMVGYATLAEQNKSGQSGTVYWQEKNGKLVVTVDITPGPKDVAQPAHFHLGTCDKPGEIKYPLNDVVNGKSTTTLEVSAADLLKELPLIVNVHKSQSQISLYVACGDVTADAKMVTEEQMMGMMEMQKEKMEPASPSASPKN